MNIPRILSSLDECDRTKFCEAIADASHYVAIALDVLPASDHFSFPELCRALNHLNDLNDEIQAHLCDADDDAGDAETLDFSGIEKAIAAEKKSAKAKKNKKSEFFGHAKALQMKKQQAKKAAASEGVE